MIFDFTEFLNEGRYDNAILSITREFINNFKEHFGIRYKYTTDYEHDEFIIVKITILAKPSKKVNYDFDVEGNSDINQITINIVYNPEWFPFVYNKFIAEIKNTLRHEMTHIKQYVIELEEGEDDEASEFDSETYTEDDLDEYLPQKAEVEAYVNGFYKEAKTKKTTFTKVIDDWLEDNYKHFKDKKNALKIRKIWINDFKSRYGTKYL
jgi:hypothetical protein